MDVVGDLVARERRTDDLAFGLDSRAASYSYETACTDAWKAGNLLRHYGVRAGASVAIAPAETPTPQPLLAFLGAALLGATVRFDPPAGTDANALVVPADAVERYDPGPGTQVFAYGAVPETPGVAHFEREAWSENPTRPPETVDPGSVVLATDDGTERYTHERLLSAAERVVDEYGVDADDEVTLRAPLAVPGTVVAGVLAPLSVRGTVLLDRERTGTLAVAGGNAPDERTVRPDAVFDGRDAGASAKR